MHDDQQRCHELATEVLDPARLTGESYQDKLLLLRHQAIKILEQWPAATDREIRDGLRETLKTPAQESYSRRVVQLDLASSEIEALLPTSVTVEHHQYPLTDEAIDEMQQNVVGAVEEQIFAGTWPEQRSIAKQRLRWLCASETSKVRRLVEQEIRVRESSAEDG